MTAGIQGTGPYAKLRELRTLARQCAYEIAMFQHGPRKLSRLRKDAAEIARRIGEVNAQIKR